MFWPSHWHAVGFAAAVMLGVTPAAAKAGCPVSKLLKADVSLDATLPGRITTPILKLEIDPSNNLTMPYRVRLSDRLHGVWHDAANYRSGIMAGLAIFDLAGDLHDASSGRRPRARSGSEDLAAAGRPDHPP